VLPIGPIPSPIWIDFLVIVQHTVVEDQVMPGRRWVMEVASDSLLLYGVVGAVGQRCGCSVLHSGRWWRPFDTHRLSRRISISVQRLPIQTWQARCPFDVCRGDRASQRPDLSGTTPYFSRRAVRRCVAGCVAHRSREGPWRWE
jgi:hypothetical protein